MLVGDLVVNFERPEDLFRRLAHGYRIVKRGYRDGRALVCFFEAREPKRAVFHERSADSKPTLVLEERRAASWIGLIVKEIGSAKISPAEISMAITVNRVRAGLGDDIQNQATGLAVPPVVLIFYHLKFFPFPNHCSPPIPPPYHLF